MASYHPTNEETNSLIHLKQLRLKFDRLIIEGKSFEEVKRVHNEIKHVEATLSVIFENTHIADPFTLMPLRPYMSLDQLERYGDYLGHRNPSKPFTWEEVRQILIKSVETSTQSKEIPKERSGMKITNNSL